MKSYMAATLVTAGVMMAAAVPAYALPVPPSSCAGALPATMCVVAEGVVTENPGTSQFNLARQAPLPAAGTKFTDYYTFTISSAVDPMGLMIDASFNLSGTGHGQSIKPVVMLTLYSGVPTTGTKVVAGPGEVTSTNSITTDIVASLDPGTYYIQVNGTSKGTAGGYGGTVSFSSNTVPLPNSVALLGMAIAGLGVAGVARRRAVKTA